MSKANHLSDDRLVEMCVYDAPAAHERQHLGACAECEARRVRLASLLDELSQAAVAQSDVVFPADRLTRQRARILHRLEQDGRPARVIAFPVGHPQDAPARARPATRWIAAAAVAGLVVGVMAGRLGQEGPRRMSLVPQAATSRAVPATTLRATTAAISDDELLAQIEIAIDGRGGSALRPLDELTPTAWEVR